MLLKTIIFHTVLKFARFNLSELDPVAQDEVEKLKKNKDFLSNHNGVLNHPQQFGNISVASLNLHTEYSLNEPEMLKEVLRIIDNSHPTVMCLQGASEKMVKLLKHEMNKTNGHYELRGPIDSYIDKNTNKREFYPIIVDKSAVTVLKIVSIKPNQSDGGAPATWALLKVNNVPGENLHIFNIDFFSIVEKLNELKLYNLFLQLREAGLEGDSYIIAGTINAMTPTMKNLFKNLFKGTFPEDDPNNKGLSLSTFHSYTKRKENNQRDFLYFHSGENAELHMNSFRILQEKRKKMFEHHPLFGIYTFTPKVSNTNRFLQQPAARV